MFFDPLWLYLKGLIVTLVVKVGLFTIIISHKPIKILAVSFFNVLSHILLHLFFTLIIRTQLGYSFWIWLTGEILVVLFEAALYRLGRIISKFTKALLWSLVFNAASIVFGQIINLFFFLFYE